MPIHIDPVTQQRVVYQKHTGDLQYFLTGDTAISQETVPVIGNWSDFTGSAVVNSRTQQMSAGTSNALQGEDAGIDGAKLPQLNEVGQRSETTRRRQILRRVQL